jgi:hypothetical protein
MLPSSDERMGAPNDDSCMTARSVTRNASADDGCYSYADVVGPAELYQHTLTHGGIIATIGNMSRKVTRALPEIGWGGGTWIDFEIEPGNNLISTNSARKKSRAKRERREKVFLSDWEPGFRARCKAIALTNEVIRMRITDEVPGCAEQDDLLPRPVLVAEGGGWISSTPGVTELFEPQPTYRHLRNDEYAAVQQPTSTVEVWGSNNFVGESGFSEPARRLQALPTSKLIKLREDAISRRSSTRAADESGDEDNPMRGMSRLQHLGRKELNSRRVDIEMIVDTGASYNVIGASFVEHLRPLFRKMARPEMVDTANGKVRLVDEVDLRLPAFKELQTFLVGPATCPPLLGIGPYCMHKGYSFI